MPNGTTTGPTRALAVCESNAPRCPRCGGLLALTAGEGAFLATCRRKRGGEYCGQSVAVVGLSGRVCLVIQLEAHELSRLQAQEVTPDAVLKALGLLDAPLTTMVPAA